MKFATAAITAALAAVMMSTAARADAPVKLVEGALLCVSQNDLKAARIAALELSKPDAIKAIMSMITQHRCVMADTSKEFMLVSGSMWDEDRKVRLKGYPVELWTTRGALR